MSANSEIMSFLIVTDIGCDADDLLATVLLVNVLRQRSQRARIAFVLTMLNPRDKAVYVNHLISKMNVSEDFLDIKIYVAQGYETMEDASIVFPNFPPRFGEPYDQLQGINASELRKDNIFPVDKLSDFTDECADHSIHLLVLSPVAMVNQINFDKINWDTAHMMAGITDRKGVKKIGYNVGVSPKSFVALCQKTDSRLSIVSPVTCDNVRMAVNLQLVKNIIKLDPLGEFIFKSMMNWHDYITKGHTNFLEIDTPCISDLVAADVFLRKVFPSYHESLEALLNRAVKDESKSTLPTSLATTVSYRPDHMSIDESCTLSYLDDVDGALFNAENGTKVTFLDAILNFSDVTINDYGTYLMAAVFANF